jgi:glycerophosphoryl diester phosphodiesterase
VREVIHMKKKLLGLLVVVLLLSAGAFAEVIYSQDFEDNKMPDDFLVVEGSWRVVNGQLIGESPNSSVQGRVVFGPVMDSFVYTVDVTILNVVESTRWFSIFFRSTEDGSAPYHMFTIRQGASAHNGTELAFRHPQGYWDVRRTKPYERDFGFRETFTLTVAVDGDLFLYFINGELQFAAYENGYRDEGIFGLHVNGCRVAFDNIKIEKYEHSKFRQYEREAY